MPPVTSAMPSTSLSVIASAVPLPVRLHPARIDEVDRHVRPSRDVDRLVVARHLRQEQEALGDEDERLLPPEPHQRLERLLQAAEADLGAAPDLRDHLLLLDRGVGVADNGELAGTAARPEPAPVTAADIPPIPSCPYSSARTLAQSP